MLKSCATVGEGEGAVRTVQFKGWWASEELSELDNIGHSLTYLITGSNRPEVVGAFGTMALTEMGSQQTRLEWRTQQRDDNPQEAELDAQLSAYYPTRVNHLRAALGLPAQD